MVVIEFLSRSRKAIVWFNYRWLGENHWTENNFF